MYSSLYKLILLEFAVQNFILFSYNSFLTGLAEAARGRGNSRANYPSVRLIIAANALLLLLITSFVSRGIRKLTFLSVHSPLITS